MTGRLGGKYISICVYTYIVLSAGSAVKSKIENKKVKGKNTRQNAKSS
jgi:hypothetical protein